MVISVRFSEEETALVKQFAKLHNITVSEFVRKTIIERIENEIDLRAYEKAKTEYEADPVTYSHEEVVKELNIY